MASPANQFTPRYNPADREPITAHVATAVTGKRFVAPSAAAQVGWAGLSTVADGGNIKIAPAAAGVRPLGVAGYDGAVADKVPVWSGTAGPVKAGASITAGQEVEVGTNGQAIPLASGRPAGLALDSAASGADCLIWIYN